MSVIRTNPKKKPRKYQHTSLRRQITDEAQLSDTTLQSYENIEVGGDVQEFSQRYATAEVGVGSGNNSSNFLTMTRKGILKSISLSGVWWDTGTVNYIFIGVAVYRGNSAILQHDITLSSTEKSQSLSIFPNLVLEVGDVIQYIRGASLSAGTINILPIVEVNGINL